MTAKSYKFPLHLSSLGNSSKSPINHTTNKLSRPLLNIEMPQTATQNAQQHVTRNAEQILEKREKKQVTTLFNQVMAQKGMQYAEPVISRLNSEYNNEHKTQHQRKMMSYPVGFEGPRRAMVTRLMKQGIKDEIVLAALGTIPRHQFIEQGLVGQAYIDASLPIGYQQTISQPYIVARMIEVVRNGRELNNILEIGTGCGYQAAVLAQVAKNVYSIERIKLLQELAKKNLRSLRIPNLRLHYGDGMHGLPQVAPFDGIILAAAGMQIPNVLLQQLAIGGRLIAPVGEKQQALQLVERTGNAEWTQSVLEECYFVPLCSGTI
jgi:protein-L-isoaspartate(D-aspartate) O-methyltransferase